MKKTVLLLISFYCLTAISANADSPQTELRSRTDSVSYYFGVLYGQQFTEREFFIQNLDIESFIAGIKDSLYDTVMDADFSDVDPEGYIDERYERYQEEKASRRDLEERAMMAEEGYISFRDDAYFKIVREGTGKQATDDDQVVMIHTRTFDEDGNTLHDTREDEGADMVDGEDIFGFFGDKIKPYLSEGVVILIRARKWGYDYEDDDYPQEYDNVEFEIVHISDPE